MRSYLQQTDMGGQPMKQALDIEFRTTLVVARWVMKIIFCDPEELLITGSKN